MSAAVKIAGVTIWEVWNSKWTKNAVEDQAGRRHYAEVVYERVLIEQIGTEPHTCAYTNRTDPNGTIVCRDLVGNIYRSYPQIDYCAVRSFKRESDGRWFRRAPENTVGYVTPNGERVERLLP